MKRRMHMFILLTLAGWFLGCDDNDQWLPGDIPDRGETKMYSNKLGAPIGSNTLALTYSGQELIGKDVAFTLGNDGKATLTLKGVLPGETETVVNGVALTQTDGGYAFSGNATGNVGTTFAFSGKIAEKQLSLSLTDVKVPAGLLENEEMLYLVRYTTHPKDSSRAYYETIDGKRKRFSYYWYHNQTPMKVSLLKITGTGMMDMGGILAPIFGKLVYTLFNGVTFQPDGNVIASYASIPDTLDISKYMMSGPLNILERPASDWQTSPMNLVTYYTTNDTTLYVVPNVDMIIRQIGLDQAQTRAGGGNNLIVLGQFYKLLNRWSTQGIKLTVKRNDPNQYIDVVTTDRPTSFSQTFTRYECDYILTLDKKEADPLLAVVDILGDLLPEDVLNTPLMGSITVNSLLSMAQNLDDFYLKLYFQRQPSR